MTEDFRCPRCARAIVRPTGAETWCACALFIPRFDLAEHLQIMLVTAQINHYERFTAPAQFAGGLP